MTEDNKPYIQISRGRRWGFKITIIDPGFPTRSNNRSARMYSTTWFSFKFDKARKKGLRKLAKYNALRIREAEAWKVVQ